MNAIGWDAEVDPTRANRIARSRLDGEPMIYLHAFESEFRVVMIGRVQRYAAHLEHAARRWLLPASDGSWIESDQAALVVKRRQRAIQFVEYDSYDFARRPRSNIGDHNMRSDWPKSIRGFSLSSI